MPERLQKWIVLVAPRHARDWIVAMICEASYATGAERGQWPLAILRVAVASRLRSWSKPVQACALAAAMIAIDWRSGAFLPALALIALSAFVLTRGRARGHPTALIVAGGTLPLAHALANWVPRLRPAYQYAPLRFIDWAILLAVAIVGIGTVRIAQLFSSRPSPADS